jgi:hypothetical protein
VKDWRVFVAAVAAGALLAVALTVLFVTVVLDW